MELLGYESISPFTSEYKRFFGEPSLRNVKARDSRRLQPSSGAPNSSRRFRVSIDMREVAARTVNIVHHNATLLPQETQQD